MDNEWMNLDDGVLFLGPLQTHIYLLVAPRRALREMIGAAAARLALEREVRLLDGGNLYDAHATARKVYRQTRAQDVSEQAPDTSAQAAERKPDAAPLPPMRDATPAEAALERIAVARAFTCYQMEALLAGLAVDPRPVLILDLLATFSDENAPQAHRRQLMLQIIEHLRRLAKAAPVLVGITPDLSPPLDLFTGWLTLAASRVLRYEQVQDNRQLPLL